MTFERTDRGFETVNHPIYADWDAHEARIVQQSSFIGNYTDALERPGTSALWIGRDHRLNREEVAELRDRLSEWLETGSLRMAWDKQ